MSLINEEGSGNEKGKDIAGGRGRGKEIRDYTEVLLARIQCVSEDTVGNGKRQGPVETGCSRRIKLGEGKTGSRQ